MIREMNRDIFSEYLEMTIDEIKQNEGIKEIAEDFTIVTVKEKDRLLCGKEEVMRLNILNENRIPDHKGKPVLQLKCSLRLRKPSLLRNQELGHPPFRAVV